MKSILWVLIAVAVLVGAFFALNSYIYNEKQGEFADNQNPTLITHTFEWIIEPSARFEETMPWQNLTLVFDGKKFPVGEYLGCAGIVATTLEGEITRKTCWFGGGGDDVSVFLENGEYVVKTRWIQESGGPEVNAEPTGPWEVLFVVN
jgi:hypothetical protein